jgi:choline dehydrogenase-like flavoprotein
MVAARPAVWREHKPRNLFTGDDVVGATVLDADVVVVGSGAGGSTIAAELAEAGFDVVILEEGGYFTTRDFTAEATKMVRAMYRDGGALMALGNPPILLQEGRAVGGSTVVNGGMSWRTPERVLDRWAREHALVDIDAKAMEPLFERVERRINVAPQDPESVGMDNTLLRQGAEAMGWKVKGNLRNQVHCPGSNNCAFGCPTGAKQSALVTYVPRALHFGARLWADVRVDRITRHGKRATGVVGHVIRPDGSRGPDVVVRAKLVVSSCGALQTPALLERSGFRPPSGRLGHNLSLHPNAKLVAVFDRDVRGWEGTHQAYKVIEFESEGFTFAAVNVPPSVTAMSTAVTAGVHGAKLGALMADYDKMVIAGMLLEDTVTGRVRTIAGRPQAFYQISDHDAERMVRGVALLSEALFAAGAKTIHLPFEGVAPLTSADGARKLYREHIPARTMELLTVHMMGTAAIGGDRTRAVCDGWGLVHDAAGLMVADASVFPTPIGVNPMETIMGLATRFAGHVIDNKKRFV